MKENTCTSKLKGNEKKITLTKLMFQPMSDVAIIYVK